MVNAVSGVPVIVDGQFSAGVAGTPEWSDVTPLAFISGNPGPKVTSRTDPLADSFVYTGLAPGLAVGDGNALYLMYDYHSRTNPFAAGDTIASISFPIHLAPPAFTESLVTVGLALADTQTLVTVTFEEHDGKTVQHFHQTPFSTVEYRDGHVVGWNTHFDKEQAYAERLAKGEKP